MNHFKANKGLNVVVLIVDDVPDNLAVLHDALDESGVMVLVANNGEAALAAATDAKPDIILLDAIMPGMDGFEVCRRLKADINTRHIPVIFMTGLTESEHVVAAFQAGGTDYITKPVRAVEVLARIDAHMQTSRLMRQARGALDAFGQAAIAITPQNGKIVWQTPLARELMQRYFTNHFAENQPHTPAQLLSWIQSVAGSGLDREKIAPLTIIQARGRLIFVPADIQDEEQWIILLREESDAAQIEALMTLFKLTIRESEVLYWATKGKTSKDIGDILGTSPRTVNKHLEHVFVKLGVETRTAAASLAASKIRIMK
jgi:DNA-binding response OmpR family regulator/DNA-binding CsgD family transcriptional regulator